MCSQNYVRSDRKFTFFPDFNSSRLCTQQNSFSISHLLGTVITLWLDSDGVVTVDNCWQHRDYTVQQCVVTLLPAVNNSNYTGHGPVNMPRRWLMEWSFAVYV